MSISLYRKYRPQDFTSVYGQEAAVKIILNSISKSRIGHAYLFSGSRGCGKTSVVRIFAKALNCTNPKNFEPCCECKNCIDITAGQSLDVIEIDGASSNGVDEIRELKSHVALTPFNSRYKIYIIDEVHMLSTAAFNALLKTLEEPPEYVVFILATTEPHKVPVTIRSRCQHIPFHSISPENIFARLNEVCKLENIKAEADALWEISRQADGALRDALSLLEQVIAAGDVTLKNIESMLGAGSRPEFERYIIKIREDIASAYPEIKKMLDAGATPLRIFEEIFSLVKDLWLSSKYPDMIDTLGISEQDRDFLKSESKQWPVKRLQRILNALVKIMAQAKSGIRQDILAGLFVFELEKSENEPEQIQSQRQHFNQDRPLARMYVSQNTQALNTQPQIISDNNEKNETQKNSQSFTELNTLLNISPDDYDPVLSEKIINTAHEKNFVVYCGLIGSKAATRENKLVIMFDNEYAFTVMKLFVNSSEIKKMFSDYSEIIFNFKGNIFKCAGDVKNSADLNSSSQGVQKNITFENFETAPLPEQQTQIIKTETRRSISGAEKFIDELKRLGVKAEILIKKHADESENDDDSEIDNNINSDNDNEESDQN